jgi:molecular chaperone DnaJ
MNLKEAHDILELSPGVSPDDAKKKYRELTKKYHPDVNKELGAEDKFKKINEAYRCVQSGKGTDREEPMIRNPFEHININPFGRQQRKYTEQPQHIQVNTTISFKESVLGCKKEVSFSRKAKCPDCDGSGEVNLNNGCDKCKGLGSITNRQGNMIFTQTCDKCGGRVKSQDCDKCKSEGNLESQVSVQVQIPGGIQNGNILRLGGMGNYVTNFMGMDQYTDAHLFVSVTPHESLKIQGNDVVFDLKISLLEAISGCIKSVDTINGSEKIVIDPKSRNKDEVVIKNIGVNGTGCQRVILDVIYPDDIIKLVASLTKVNVLA